MKKSNSSIKNICISKIEKSYVLPFDFKYTGIFNDKHVNFPSESIKEIILLEEEELICSTFVNE